MLTTADTVYKQSGGALDLTIYPLVKRWGFEDGKYYVAFAAVKDNAPKEREKPYEPWEYRYGRCLTAAKNEVYLAWLTAECEKKTAMVQKLLATDTPLAAERLPGAAEELAELAGVIHRMLE